MPENSIGLRVGPRDARSRRTGLFLPFLLLIMSSYPPLSTDMYLPSLPIIGEAFDAAESTINLTLILFFIFFAFSTLVFGPLADKYGRKPSLIVGVSLFTAASLGCVWASTANQLIFWRIVQAIGAGAPVTISLAIVQDTYSGETKRKILAPLTALMMIAPVMAPTLGSIVLTFAPWRTIFMILFGLGVFSLFGCLFIRESLPVKNDKPLIRTFGSLFQVLKVVFFRRALLVFSLPAIFVLGFVGGSALIFMSEFGQSGTAFSIFFAANALVAILGSAVYVPAAKRFSLKTIALVSFPGIAASGLLIILLGQTNAIVFLLCVLPGTFMAAVLRPLGITMMMDAGGPDTGASSALVNFFFMILGSLGMQILACPWTSRAVAYGVSALLVGVVCFFLWFRIHKTMDSGWR